MLIILNYVQEITFTSKRITYSEGFFPPLGLAGNSVKLLLKSLFLYKGERGDKKNTAVETIFTVKFKNICY